MATRPCLRPWKDEYQLLCSIDSVSGEMKSISPFQVPRQSQIDNHIAASIESHFKVIETIMDYQESKAFRARMSGAISAFWSFESNASGLDSAKVNSKDIFGYYSLLFTKSRVVVNSSTLCNLPLTKDAAQAIRNGKFRDLYGDMIVVGYITGGEAEAVLRVTNFKEDHRDSIRKALRTAMLNNDSDARPGGSVALDAVLPSAAVEFQNSHDDMRVLQDATTTLLSRRTGVTLQSQLRNPSSFPLLLMELTKAAENTGVKISALCYRIELFSQVPVDVLGFARVVVDENVNTLQRQFAQVQFVYNSCEAHLAPNAISSVPESVLRDVRKLNTEAVAAMQRFAQFKGYRDVGQLSPSDFVRTAGSQLVQRFEDLCEKMRAAIVKEKLQQKLVDEGAAELRDASVSSTLPPSPVPQTWQQGQQGQQQTYCSGVLQGQLMAGRNFTTGKVLSCQPYAIIKLDGKTIPTSTLPAIKAQTTFMWNFKFKLDVPARLLVEDATLELEVYGKVRFGRDKHLGTVTVPLRQVCIHTQLLAGITSNLLTDPAVNTRHKITWYPIEKVDSGNKYKCRGELQMALHFISGALPQQLQMPELSSKSTSPPVHQSASPPVRQSSSADDSISSTCMSPLQRGIDRGSVSGGDAAMPGHPFVSRTCDISLGVPISFAGAVPAGPWSSGGAQLGISVPSQEPGPLERPVLGEGGPQRYAFQRASPVGSASDAHGMQLPMAAPATEHAAKQDDDEPQRQPLASTSAAVGVDRQVKVKNMSSGNAVAAVAGAASASKVPATKPVQGTPKKKRQRRVLRFLLTVAGAALASTGAVVLGRKRFGVDLVAESRRLAVQYGQITGRTISMWARSGGSAVHERTGKLAASLRSWRAGGNSGAANSADGGATIGVAAGEEAGIAST